MDAQRQLRFALGEFATGVCIITARSHGGERVGVTMNSFNSVSIDPPLVLFSVDRRAHSLPVFEDARGIAINVLARSQALLSNRFARTRADKWDGISFADGFGGAPLIDGALAYFECRPYAAHDGGDHRIFVVEVLRHTVGREGDMPLLFFRGHYRELGPGEGEMASWPLPIHY